MAGYATTYSADCEGTIAIGETKTCTVTNDDIPARLTVNKVCAPTTDDGLFDLKIDTVVRADDAACGGTTGEVLINAGTHYVTEAAGTGTNLADYVTSIGGACTPAGAVTLGLGQSATCTITNTRKGKATVVKTVAGLTPASNQTFTFELRSGAAPNADGTVLETKTTDATGNINFSTLLVPSQTYQICEWVMPGWNTNLSGDGPLFVPNSIIPPSLPNPNVNNMAVCANFTVTPGQERTFTVDNTPPPGGRALTIGFWKNWASCSGSKGNGQDPMLDLALAIATQQTPEPAGRNGGLRWDVGAGWPIFGPTYYLILKGDPNSTPDNILPAPGCAYAVSLLDKRTTVSGKKMASDPLFNMTAQLVAAEANRFMGAGISGDTIMNINKAVVLDGEVQVQRERVQGKADGS